METIMDINNSNITTIFMSYIKLVEEVNKLRNENSELKNENDKIKKELLCSNIKKRTKKVKSDNENEEENKKIDVEQIIPIIKNKFTFDDKNSYILSTDIKIYIENILHIKMSEFNEVATQLGAIYNKHLSSTKSKRGYTNIKMIEEENVKYNVNKEM